MSALSEAKADGAITDGLLKLAEPLFAAAVWAWFDAHKSDVLFSKWAFIKIRVGDFQGIIEAIAGPDPSTPVTGA